MLDRSCVPQKLSRWLGLGLFVFCMATGLRGDEPSDVARPSDGPLGSVAPDLAFEATTVGGNSFALRFEPGGSSTWTVVCFLGTECPLAKLYAARLQELQEAFATKNVRFVGIVSNQQDSAADVLEFIRHHELKFDFIRDEANRLADRFGAERTPEVFVLDQQLTIRYQGRIDDQYTPGTSRSAPTHQELRAALDELTSQKPVTKPRTVAVGCRIGRVHHTVENAEVTYSRDISRLLQKHCVECHRAGEIGPMALTDYEEVVGWGETMLEVIEDRRMPPWHAAPQHGHFVNAREMAAEEIELLRKWVAAGMPLGDTSDLPEAMPVTTGWQFNGAPEAVIAMRERPFRVPATGTVEYQYFVVDPHWAEDRWISAAQVVPGNAAVVHHAIVFVRPPDDGDFRGVGWLSAYVPGQRAAVLPPGHARKVPAGAKLVFQMHYTPNGKAQEDVTRIGLQFVDPSSVTHEVFTVMGIDQDFEIPPRANPHLVNGQVHGYPASGRLLSVAPHMHLRGKSFELTATKQGGAEILLQVPHYDFNWQHEYLFAEPINLSDIESLKFTVGFDNSPQNPVNPDPTQRVTWGDQTWEEMAVVFLSVAEPMRGTGSEGQDPNGQNRPRRLLSSDTSQTANQQDRIEEFVRDFFRRLDKDGNGEVLWKETPLAVRRFSFSEFDANGDQRISREEVQQVAVERFGRP